MEIRLAALEVIAREAPRNILVPLTTEEVNDEIGADSSQWAHWLRKHKLIRTDVQLGSSKTIRKMALTRQGEGFLTSVDKYGMRAAFQHTRQIYKNESKPQSMPTPQAQTFSTPEGSNKILPSRSSALAEAKRHLGPDAPLADVLQVAKFLAGDQSS